MAELLRQLRRRSLLTLRRCLLLLLFLIPVLSICVFLRRFGPYVVVAGDAGDVDDAAVSFGSGGDERERIEVASSSGMMMQGCATVEEMGASFYGGDGSREVEAESLRVRQLINRHFEVHVYAYRGIFPFGDFLAYTNNSFTMAEIKHLWRKKGCIKKYHRNLKLRKDNFESPSETDVLCGDWSQWKEPIVWFQGTADAVGIQFFLKNIHPAMRNVSTVLFGQPGSPYPRPNVFGELMRAIISPSGIIQDAVQWALDGVEPEIALHMRMLTNRSFRATRAALECLKRAIGRYNQKHKPRIVLVSDTPSFIREVAPDITDFAQIIHFDYKSYLKKYVPNINGTLELPDFRAKDWGPAPRWVAFVDFFLASRAKHTIVSGAHRRVGTTYAQLIAALAAANQHGRGNAGSDFSFFSSFPSSLLNDGLASQMGWGHIWNRFAGPLSCRNQSNQCALTPLLPPAWWDTRWQSPTARDVEKLNDYGVRLTANGDVDERELIRHCASKEERVRTFTILDKRGSHIIPTNHQRAPR